MLRSPSAIAVLLSCAPLAVALVPAGVAAQGQEIVQPLPDPATETLNDALRRLSRNPESVPALLAAGRASLDLGDVDAAQGFFARAQDVAPDDGRVLAGLALVAVRRGDAPRALRLFRDAERAGADLSPHAAEHGLAYDLVGRNDRAQRLYRLALSQDESAEVIRRLALSYAIAGNADASDATLLPLLQGQDRAAYRTRAFALAIRGRDEEAIAIAETMLPPRLSRRLEPYLRYMPRLTRAQQAAAANLGRFPAASEVGRDDPEIAALAREEDAARAQRPTPRPRAAERLEPRGEPLGPSQPEAAMAQAAPERQSGELPPVEETPVAVAVAQAPAPVAETPPGAVATSPQAPAPAPSPAPDQAEARPSFSLTDTLSGVVAAQADESASASASAPEPTSEPEPEPQAIDLAEAFSDFTLESAPLPQAEGAVDITAIEPPRELPEPAEPPRPAHPSRHWVQVATGQDTSAFRFDWRRIRRNAAELLADAGAFTAPWGQTNRLLTGPFDSAQEAQELVSALAGEGVDAFRYTSPEGEEIQQLD